MILKLSAREKSIDLIVDYDIFLPTEFIGDVGRVRQILTNVLGNAVKFTRQGHGFIRIVGLSKDSGETDIRITIEDTGIGIPQDEVSYIFCDFHRLEEAYSRQFDGTGLGLCPSPSGSSL